MYSRDKLISLLASPLVAARLHYRDLITVSGLGLAGHRRWRGCRGGADAKRSRLFKCWPQFGLVNARSVVNKCAMVHDLIVSSQLDLLAITETWLSSLNGVTCLEACSPEGYSSTHVPRMGRRGGGVALIYKDTIQIHPHPAGSFSTFELLDITVTVKSVATRLVIIYRPPARNKIQFLHEFSALLESIGSSSSGNLLIAGDFNLHVDRPDSVELEFLCLMDSFHLVQHVSAPTHVSGHLLDLVFSRATKQIVTSTWVSDIFSDHFVVHCSLRLARPQQPTKKVTFRPFKSIVIDDFAKDLASLPLLTCPASTSEGLLKQYNDGVRSTLNKHAPLQTKVFVIRPSSPWLNEDIKVARRTRRMAERRWRKNPIVVHRQLLSSARNRLGDLMESAKSSHLKGLIAECGSDQRALFRLVNGFLSRSKALRLPQHSSKRDLLNQFSSFFLNKTMEIRSQLDLAPVEAESSPETTSPVPLFDSFVPVGVSDITERILSSSNKSCSLDPIPTHVLKSVVSVLAPAITCIVNESLMSGIFPDTFKMANVTPLLKKPSLCPEQLSNYRPVSNLSYLSKLTERVVADQFVSHLNRNDLYVPVQSAYRAFHSCETSLIRVLNDLLISVDEGMGSVLLLLDLSAAFDTVDHATLIQRLCDRYGVSGRALNWFESYLSGRSQSVTVGDVASDSSAVVMGVPQGSVLGPTLFSTYSGPIYHISVRHGINSQLYADDTDFYAKFELDPEHLNQKETYGRLAGCVDETRAWMKRNKLKFNDDKSELLLVYSSRKRCQPSPLPLQVGESSLTPRASVKNLGVIIDKHLSMEEQVQSLCKKANFHIWSIGRIRRFLDDATTEKLMHAFVFSTIDSCNSLLYGLPDKLLDRLQLVQNKAARMVRRVKKHDHITPHLMALHWLPIKSRIVFKILVLTFHCLHGSAPAYLSELIKPYRPALQSRSATSPNLLCIPRIRLETYGARSFSHAAPTLWNKLPEDIRAINSMSLFRSRLKTHLFKIAYM